MESKERENTNTSLRISNTGNVFECLDMKFGGKKYETQLTSTGKKKNILCVKCTN